MTNPVVNSVLDLALSPPERPKVDTPSPYDEFDPDRRHEKFGITQYTDPGYYESAGQVAGSDDRSGSKFYSGTMGVSGLTGTVADNFVGMPKALQAGLGFTGLGGFGVGAMMSLRNLSSIEEKMKAGEAGYGVGMFNNRIIGVSPGLFGGYTLSGVLPEGLTNKQRQELIDSLLGIVDDGYYDDTTDDNTDGTSPGDDTSPGDGGDPTVPPGYDPDLPYDGYNPYPDEPKRPTPTPPSDGGGGPNYPAPSPIDDVVPGDPPPSRPPSRPDNRPPPQSDDPGGGGGGGTRPPDSIGPRPPSPPVSRPPPAPPAYQPDPEEPDRPGGGGCCFIMLEARYGDGTLDDVVRRYRDEHMTARNKRGYYKLAEVLVPLMRKSKLAKWLVTKTFADPLVSYGKYYYGQNKHGVIFAPLKSFWMSVFNIVGGNTEFIKENGKVV